MNRLAVICALCTVMTAESHAKSRPEGEPLLSIKITAGAFSGPIKEDTGFFFYLHDPGENVTGPIVEFYCLNRGKIVQSGDGGSPSAEVVEAIKSLRFENFDFREEVEKTSNRLRSEAEERGEQFFGPMVLDGKEVEIVFNFGDTHFVMKDWNPGPSIYFYAQHNERIAALRDLLNLFAIYYSRLQFGIF